MGRNLTVQYCTDSLAAVESAQTYLCQNKVQQLCSADRKRRVLERYANTTARTPLNDWY
jgi:hypothetical protein